jgi:hypothetical protein
MKMKLSWVFLFMNFCFGGFCFAADVVDAPIVSGPNLSICSAQFADLMKQRNSLIGGTEKFLARRRILEANLPAYAKDVKSIYFQHNQPGLSFYVEHGPYKNMGMNGVDAKQFRLIYDPSKFSKSSIIRRTLGEKPLNYSMDDVREFSQTRLSGDEGTIFEVYLKGIPGSVDRNEDGGLIMISRDTGQIRFYAPGTDVDASAAGVVKGSISAIWGFAKGLAGRPSVAYANIQVNGLPIGRF